MNAIHCMLATTVLATGTWSLAGSPRGDGQPACELEMLTPYWTPESVGEWGDIVGMYASTTSGDEIAMSTYSTYFIPGAENMHGHIRQVAVINRETQEAELISVAYNPEKGETHSANAHCEWYLDMSPNGRYVAFATTATNLVSDEVSGEYFQTYVRDRQEQVTYLVSKSTDGEVANDWGTDVRIGVSNNGKVAFASRATNLHPDQPLNMWAVYVHDVHTGVTELVSRDVNGDPATIDSWYPDISADGTVVAFVSIDQLVPGLTFESQNVFVRDLATNRTEIMSVDPQGADRPGAGFYPQLSNDGKRVAFRFESMTTPLDPNFPNGYAEAVYVRDRAADEIIGVTKTWQNLPFHTNPEGGFTLSGDGRFIALESPEEIIPGDLSGGPWHVYHRNIDTGETQMVTVDRLCQPTEMNDMMWSVISGDGSRVTFVTMADVMLDEKTKHDWTHHLYQWVDPNYQEPKIEPGDLDGNGVIDVSDLLILLSGWGECDDICDADLNSDGVVDVSDLLMLLGNWG